MKPNGVRLLIVAHALDTGGGAPWFLGTRNDRLSADVVKKKYFRKTVRDPGARAGQCLIHPADDNGGLVTGIGSYFRNREVISIIQGPFKNDDLFLLVMTNA